MICPCGMPLSPVVNGVRLTTFSREWHVMHRDYHVVVFPDVDPGTVRNLDDAIRRAS